ncbi:hypothetical protein ACOI9X_23745 [Pseudomonas sp. P2757]|uniref:hypothetical protein n=1 Tax=unclassified Pseudomonas TaxID=196821 RepID=UPI003B5A5041
MALYLPLFPALVDETGVWVLAVGKANDPEQVRVDPYLGAQLGDVVKLILQTAAREWSHQQPAAQNAATVFDIPKADFIDGLVAGPAAKLKYTITQSSGKSETSLDLEFELRD